MATYKEMYKTITTHVLNQSSLSNVSHLAMDAEQNAADSCEELQQQAFDNVGNPTDAYLQFYFGTLESLLSDKWYAHNSPEADAFFKEIGVKW